MISSVINVADNNLAQRSLPTQKTAHFRPNTSEIWVANTDGIEDGLHHRGFYRCQDGVSMGLVTNWMPEPDLTLLVVSKTYTVSFEFSPDGTKIHATTCAWVYTDPTLLHTRQYVYYGIYDIEDDAWTNTILYSEDDPVDLLNYPDITMDLRPTPKPIIVACTFGGVTPKIYVFSYKNTGALYTQILTNGDIAPSYPASVLADPGNFMLHIHAMDQDGSTYLYAIQFDAFGIPLMPTQFNPWAQPNLRYAQLALGAATVGLLGKNNNDYLAFRHWTGAELSDAEVVYQGLTQDFGFGLCFRNGTWKAFFCFEVGTQTQTPVIYDRMDDGTEPDWVHSNIVLSLTPGLWDFFGIIADQFNPTLIDASNFGAIMLNKSGSSPFDVVFVYIHATPVAPQLPYGQILNSSVFGINLSDGQCHLVKSESSLQHMQDALVFDNQTIFTDRHKFYYFWDQYKDILPDASYATRRFKFESGLYDGGIVSEKMVYALSPQAEIDESSWIDLVVYADDSVNVAMVGDPALGQSGLVAGDLESPIPLKLHGVAFAVQVIENSLKAFTLNAIQLFSRYFGGFR